MTMKVLKNPTLIPTVVVFVAVMTVVVISFAMSRNNSNQELRANVQSYTEATEGSVRDRLNVFEETLRAGLGLFAGNGGMVSRQQWRDFISTSAVLERYPGAQSVSYAKVVPADQLDAFVEQTRQSGVPDFTITPAGSQPYSTPILYTEPSTNNSRRVLGFNGQSEETRAKAMAAARDSAKVTITNTVQSPFDASTAGRAFIMYAPQYKTGMPLGTVEERRAAIDGYLQVGFLVDTFMENVVPAQNNSELAFTMTLGDDNEPIYKSSRYDEVQGSRHATQTNTLTIANTTVRFNFVYDMGEVLPTVSSRPFAVLVFGTITALLIAGAVWLVLRGKAHELLLEKERSINEAKDNLLSLASHQLRTPATGVKQYLGLVLQGFSGEITPQQRDLLDKAYAGNERQLKTINDVLYLARLGSGRVVLSKSQFSVGQLITDIVAELNEEINARHHRVKAQIPKKDRLFYGDEHTVRMAIENLLTNAIKYTHDKGIITIRLSYGKNMQILVQDNGVGIPADQQSRMFKQFERIENDLSIGVGGTGIGLYVVQNIVDMHEGHIEVDSEQGKGSTFRMVLPFIVAPPQDEV